MLKFMGSRTPAPPLDCLQNCSGLKATGLRALSLETRRRTLVHSINSTHYMVTLTVPKTRASTPLQPVRFFTRPIHLPKEGMHRKGATDASTVNL